uniref:Uncharacterized protein Mb2253c family n=1 Tax=Cajanus cajan TaxID=3821 RepID=A0A151RW66_CAJCA|nr:Uncharacterized protein Mb2253c family [Cajanus cajan]
MPVYFVSRVLQGAKVRYQKIEKLAFTILVTARKLRHYFQSYEIIIRTDYLIRQVLQKPDLAGRMMKWSIELSEFASNNQAEYEALLAGMTLTKEMGAINLSARSDSQLVTGQVAGTFQAKDPQLAKYLEKVKVMSADFTKFSLNHVPREQNSTKKPRATRSVIQETLAQPSINEPQESVLFIQEELDSWMGPYIAYLTRGELLEDKREASLVQRESSRFVVINERLYRRGFSTPLLKCLTTSQAQRVMDEVHGGMCGSHIGGQALV